MQNKYIWINNTNFSSDTIKITSINKQKGIYIYGKNVF